MKRTITRCLANLVLLSMLLAIILQILPQTAYSSEYIEDPIQRLGEIEFFRETNSETYLLSDGSYECVVYAGDKYYRDNRNGLKLIDNTLILDEATAKTDNRHYKNTANSFQVTFSDSDTPTVTMAKDGLGITFRAESASGGNPFQTASTQKAVTVGAVRNCDTLTDLTDTGSDTIAYTNAFYSTDLVYVLQNNALKEYIVLKNADAPNAIIFRFSTEGLTLTELDGIGVFLDEDNNEVFRLDRLFAVDGNGDMTEELTYTFASVKGSRDILVTVTLDAEYLAEEDRAFPVVIDPSVMISSAQTADASVYSGYPDTNYQMEKRLRTGKDTTYGKRRAYLRFNLPSNIPANKVTEATLDLKKHSGVAPAVRAYRCESEWSSGTITWNNMPSYTVANLSSESVPRSSGSAWYEMDVTLIVKDWLDNTYSNYGFVVRDNVESNTDRWTTFYSSDAPSPNKPELRITYTGEEIGLALPSSVSGTISAGGEKVYKYTPSTSGKYSVWTTGNTNTTIRIYSSYLSNAPMVTSTGGGHGTNACANVSLSAGTTYYFVVSGNTSSTSGSYVLKFQRGLPMSGSEQPQYYDAFELYKNSCNCYAYALTCLADPVTGASFAVGGIFPGEIAWGAMQIDYTDLDSAKYSIVESVRADCEEWGGQGSTDFYEVEANEMVPSGYYKVALAVNILGGGNGSYHWYRQISDGAGLWAHKMGSASVSTVDDDNQSIYDPADASVYGLQFVAYFALKPPHTDLQLPIDAKTTIPMENFVGAAEGGV